MLSIIVEINVSFNQESTISLYRWQRNRWQKTLSSGERIKIVSVMNQKHLLEDFLERKIDIQIGLLIPSE